MNIFFITTKLNITGGGGSNHSLHLVASKLADMGNRVSVITLLPGLNAFPPGLHYQVIVEGKSSKGDYTQRDTLTLHNILRKYENEVDIYHLWDPQLVLGGAIYKLLGGKIPLVAYLNGYSFCNNLNLMDAECYKNCGLVSRIRHRPEKLIRKAILTPLRVLKYYSEILLTNKIDAFIPNSPAVAEIYASQHFDREKMHIIPAGIDYTQLTDFKGKFASRAFNSKDFNIIFVGRLEWLKGVDILIRAILKCDFAGNVYIVGSGPQKEDLENLARESGLSGRVLFLGWVSYESVLDYYLASQLFIHPARWPEPLSRTILDAMALGLPVIVSDCGGSPWAIQDAGMVFRPGEVNDLADKIMSVYKNPSLAEDMSKKARNRAKDFDCTHTIPELIKVYRSLLR